MRRPVIALTCVFLAATLVSPGVAIAKGGNGHHHAGPPEASDKGKAKAEKGKAQKSHAGKGKAQKSDAGKKPAKTAKPKAASKPQTATAKNVEKPTRKAPKAKVAEKAEEPQAATLEQPASTPAPSTKPAADSPPSTGLAEGRTSSETIGTADLETRGVLDTIRVKVNVSLERMRATVAGIGSAVTSLLGD